MRLKFPDLSNILNYYSIIVISILFNTGVLVYYLRGIIIIIGVAEHLVNRRRTVFYCLDITKERMLT